MLPSCFHSSPPAHTPPLALLLFDLSILVLGSRREETLHFSAAGFVPSIFCAFPTLYLTAFLAEIKDMVGALIHQCTVLYTSQSTSLPLSAAVCIFITSIFSKRVMEGWLFKFWPLWCTLWLVRGHRDGCASA